MDGLDLLSSPTCSLLNVIAIFNLIPVTSKAMIIVIIRHLYSMGALMAVIVW